MEEEPYDENKLTTEEEKKLKDEKQPTVKQEEKMKQTQEELWRCTHQTVPQKEMGQCEPNPLWKLEQ